MAIFTSILNLLKKNPATDGADTFNIQTMLNDNWDKIDAALALKGANGSVRAATATNTPLSGLQTVDGVSLAAGDRVLVKDQTTGSQNGIYVAAAGAWVRAADADASAKLAAGLMVYVREGTTNRGKGFVLSNTGTPTLGTTALTFMSIQAPLDVAATASTAIVRDNAGRAQVAAPSGAADIARKDTVDAAIATAAADATTKTNAVQSSLTAHIGNGGAAHAAATTSVAGFMSAADKSKLDGLASGAGGTGTATDTVIGNRTISDATAPTGDTGSLTTLFGWLANMITAITGGANWRTSPVKSLTALNTEKAPLASPTFTGTPVAPTAAAGTNTTQIATTAFATDANTTHAANNSHIPFAATTGSANTYAVTISPAPTSLTAGLGLAVQINVASTGAATINVNGLGAKSIITSKGLALPTGKLVANGVYTLRYNGTAFILQGEGGEYGTAAAAQVLSGYTYGTEDGVTSGSMPNNGSLSYTPGASAQTIPAGYTSGGTVVAVANLSAGNVKAGQTVGGVAGTFTSDATAAAGDVISGKTAYVNGNKVTGTIAVRPNYGSPANYTVGPQNMYVRLNKGAYLDGSPGTGGQWPEIVVNDPNYISSNIVAGKSVFGLGGSTPASASGTTTTVAATNSSGTYYYFNVTGLNFTPRVLVFGCLLGTNNTSSLCVYVKSGIYNGGFGTSPASFNTMYFYANNYGSNSWYSVTPTFFNVSETASPPTAANIYYGSVWVGPGFLGGVPTASFTTSQPVYWEAHA